MSESIQIKQHSPPPEWALQPLAAWLYLAVAILLALTPAFLLAGLIGIAAAIFTYQDRRAHEFPTFWWTVAVLVFGPFAYLLFVYRRPQPAVIYPPHAVMSQQARLTRGLTPQQNRPQQPAGAAPANWYPDPTRTARLRYWDGGRWTEHITD